ncbi:MAG: EF-P lysine aminoacylase EpmA [Pontibacterium sp.]
MTEQTPWQPSAPIDNLKKRAQLMSSIRQFFETRGVLEVETPVMSHCAVSDPFIDSIEVSYHPVMGAEEQRCYLQTSPEYAMKRLLAAGSGPIFQITKAFRNSEKGHRHNPEFSMLEWYRPGFDEVALMDEISDLLVATVGLNKADILTLTYEQAFEQTLAINPHDAPLEVLKAECARRYDLHMDEDDRDTWLNVLMSHSVEPALAEKGAVFITDYPASQAALARIKIDANGRQVAARFELFLNGVELANGYYELTDSSEQAVRFEADQRQRAALGLPTRPLDTRVVEALASGLPDCAGVALGIDRLVMHALNAKDIGEVISFNFARA